MGVYSLLTFLGPEGGTNTGAMPLPEALEEHALASFWQPQMLFVVGLQGSHLVSLFTGSE